MIIGLSGRMRSGKDTAGQMLKNIAWRSYQTKFEIKKFAEPVKRIASLLTGISMQELEKGSVKESYLGKEWNHPQLMRLVGDVNEARMTVREMLQKIGTDAIRDGLHPDAWVNTLMKDYKLNGWISKADWDAETTGVYDKTKDGYPKWIITDVRFPNEYKAIKDRGGIVIKIIRFSDNEDLHISETALDHISDWDYVVANNGTLEELEVKMENIWNEIHNLFNVSRTA